MHQHYHDLGLTILAINIDGKKEVAERFLKENPVHYLVARDSKGRATKHFNVQVMPTSFLLDQNGNILHTQLGFRPQDEEKLEQQIKSLLLK